MKRLAAWCLFGMMLGAPSVLAEDDAHSDDTASESDAENQDTQTQRPCRVTTPNHGSGPLPVAVDPDGCYRSYLYSLLDIGGNSASDEETDG